MISNDALFKLKVRKLILGTVQFGCNYGINTQGQPDIESVKDILEFASKNGITTLDTSAAYGNAEEVLGSILWESNDLFKIISKFPKSSNKISATFDKTLKTLGCTNLYGYLLHHFEVFKENPNIWNEFKNIRDNHYVKKIGFSLYSTSELDILLNNNIDFDLVQVPYNIFDRQFEPYFPLLKEKQVEIHVRSTFLQGLFFMNRNCLPKKLIPLKTYLDQLDCYIKLHNITIAEVALNYNLQNPYIDGVLIGVDNTKQLYDNIQSISDKKILLSIDVKEKDLLNPTNWK